MSKVALALFMSLIGAAFVAQPAAAQGTLAGETFVGNPVLTEVQCNEGGTSTFKFSSEGVAGPTIPGTYHEFGTAKIGPQAEHGFGFIVGDVLDVQAQFEIRSATGEVLVTGTKRLTEPLPVEEGSVGSCFTASGETNPHAGFSVFPNLCYRARFTATGETEQGTSLLHIEQGTIRPGGSPRSVFFEMFFPSETVTCEPPLPELKEECKAGGAFEDSALFKNQGDCVAFVATGGKNEPQKNQKNP